MNKSESKYFNTAVKMDQALISLLERKDFSYITISEICAEAGVNRSTFYLHYENTRDLLEETIRYLISDFLSYFPVDKNRITIRFADSALTDLNFITEDYLHPYLYYIQKNHRVFATALQHSRSFGFDEIFQRMFHDIFNPILERFHYPTAHRRYVMMYYLNGITAIITEWLKDGCEMPIQEIASIIQECIFGLGNTMTDLMDQ